VLIIEIPKKMRNWLIGVIVVIVIITIAGVSVWTVTDHHKEVEVYNEEPL